MPSTVAQTDPSSSSFTRRKLALLLAAIMLLAVFALAPSASALIVSQLLIDGPILLAWFGAAFGLGSLAASIRPLRSTDGTLIALRIVTRAALGLGLLSLIVLALGCAGALNQIVAIAILVVANIATVAQIHRHQAAIRSYLAGGASTGQLPLLLAMPIVGATILGALAIPWILWGDEPHAYDVVSYHFQLPREWLETGRIGATPHNVYGYFPLNVEMHYLLAMTLRGSAASGMYLAQLMHAAMMALTLVAIYGAIRQDDGHSRLRASVAVVFTAAFPWLLMLGSVGYNECGVMLFTTLSLAWTLRKQWLLAGLFAGLAAGCKITSVPTLLALAPLIVVAESLTRKRFEWRGPLVFLAAGVIAISPWLVRTAALSGGNPLFPVAARTLGAGHFDAGMVERFEIAHAARPDQQNLRARFVALNEQVLREFKFGSLAIGAVGIPCLLVLLLPALAVDRRNRSAWMLAAFIASNVAIWLFATHLQGRFLVPIIPAAALIIGNVSLRYWPGVVLIASVLSTPFSFATVYQRLTASAAQSGICFNDPSVFLPEPLVQILKSTDRPVYLVGDARTFLYPVPSARLHCRTVFDVPSDKPFREAWLGDAPPPNAIVIVAPSELERFEKTYRNLPKMPDDWRGRPMFITDVEFKSFTPLK